MLGPWMVWIVPDGPGEQASSAFGTSTPGSLHAAGLACFVAGIALFVFLLAVVTSMLRPATRGPCVLGAVIAGCVAAFSCGDEVLVLGLSGLFGSDYHAGLGFGLSVCGGVVACSAFLVLRSSISSEQSRGLSEG